MKTLFLIIALVVFGFCGLASAQCNPDPNEIGIFWTQDCGECMNCVDYVGGLITAYVVLANVTQPGGVHGFEFCLVNADGSPFLPPPNVIVVGYYVPFNGVNVFSPPCFAVGLNTPLPYSPCITLVSVDILVFSPEPWCFGVAPTTAPSIPGHMAYADGGDPGNLLIMYPNTGPGATDYAMACLNSPLCPPYPIPVEGTSWGGLKSLYR